jgi:6-pyruvoyltetrahydropterin/6-carboxytetrahydropterin synthase
MITETFKEFTFEAAHQIPPHSELHGHSFKVTVFLQGEPDPEFGWSHNLYDVETAIQQVKGELDHKYLNVIDGLQVPSLENVARWIFRQLDTRLDGVERVVVSRGFDGNVEGCTCTRGYARDVQSEATLSEPARALVAQP